MRSALIAILVDTNVLVYAYDPTERLKQAVAMSVLRDVEARGVGAISVQVLNEFFVTTTRRIVVPLTLEEAQQRIETYMSTWPVLDLTPQTTLEAIRGVRTYQLAFWDALLWATARLHGIRYLLSEDGPTGAEIDGVRWVNPFAPQFDLRML